MTQSSSAFSFLNRKDAAKFLLIMLRELRTVSLRHGFPGVLKAINQALLEVKKIEDILPATHQPVTKE